ncbi:D-aminoacyl-tRNA deacylase [Dethiosulfatarculus sandiegensis]|uniref:D-aminoacyl-tRNA deacylase n=1 Tax=Dethiosulfatarculus sandiegensis TaxID=1429043 RepID=UPI001E5FB94F|nr:D-aminoacyl-tRNA deacylase [Dethiosulfatarculus sandiegensis]
MVQRVSESRVKVGDRVTGRTGPGLLILLGVSGEDTEKESAWMADKIAGLRIFPDDQEKLNLSVMDIKGSIMVVSQFTLWGDCRKGKRPSFVRAAKGEVAEPLYRDFVQRLEQKGITVATGEFGAMMDVELVNKGPVTILVDTEKQF